MPWLLLMIYCLKCERCFGGCLSFKTFSKSSSFQAVFGLFFVCEHHDRIRFNGVCYWAGRTGICGTFDV